MGRLLARPRLRTALVGLGLLCAALALGLDALPAPRPVRARAWPCATTS